MKKIIIGFLFFTLLISTCSISTNTTFAAKKYDIATTTKVQTVYAKPGTSYKVLGKLKKKTTVKIYDAVDAGTDQKHYISASMFGFSQIKYKGKKGYVKTNDLKFKNPKAWTPHVKERVIKDIKKRYIGKKAYKLSYVGNSHYALKIKIDGKWYEYIYINCKTGWYHG